MARIRFSLNEGSLLRRTVLHVAAFVLGTAAFLAITSFLLVTIVKGALSPNKASSADDSGDESAAAATAKSDSGKPSVRPSRKKRGAAVVETPKPSEDEE